MVPFAPSPVDKGTPDTACALLTRPKHFASLYCIAHRNHFKGRCWHQVNKSNLIPGLCYQAPCGILLPMIKCYCCHYQALGLYLSTYDRPRYSGRSWDTFKGRSSYPMSNTWTFLTFFLSSFFFQPLLKWLSKQMDAATLQQISGEGSWRSLVPHYVSDPALP